MRPSTPWAMSTAPTNSPPHSTGSCRAWTATAVPAPTATCRRKLPALAGRRGGEIPAAAAARADRSGRRRSAVPADRCRRFPHQRRERQRLQQSPRERSRPDHVPAAAEHQADRSGDQRAVGRDVRGRLAQRCPRSTTSRSPGRTTSIRGRAVRTHGRLSARRRIATLQEQALGALINHAQVQRHAATAAARRPGVVSARAVHESARSRRWRTPSARAQRRCRIADPPLNALEQQGKVVFARACAPVPRRSGPVERAQAPVVRFHDISTQCPRPRRHGRRRPASRSRRARRGWRATREPTRSRWPNGAKIRRTSSDPGPRAVDGFCRRRSGRPGRLEQVRRPGLHGISKTAPYFHNNSAATLEEVVDHYIEFFKRVQVNRAWQADARRLSTTDGVHFDRP